MAKSDDNWFTRLTDVEQKLQHFYTKFKDRHVYLPCDDYEKSAFWKYLYDHFHVMELGKLTATAYNKYGKGKFAEYDGKKFTSHDMEFNGDFRNPENQDYFAEADIAITNPPFSLYGKFIKQVVDFDLDFILIAPLASVGNCVAFRQLLIDKKVMIKGAVRKFIRPDGSEKGLGDVVWVSSFTDIDQQAPYEFTAEFNPDTPKYDNCDAIHIHSYKDIPHDYDKPIGVPLNFLEHWCHDQYDILGSHHNLAKQMGNVRNGFYLNGKCLFARLIIQKII